MVLKTWFAIPDDAHVLALREDGLYTVLSDTKKMPVSRWGRRVILVLPTALWVRRSHDKPFDKLSKLKRILPYLLQEELMRKTPVQSLIVPHSLQEGQFTSYSIEDDALRASVHWAGHFINPLVGAVPSAFGLSAFRQADKDCAILAPEGQGYAFLLVQADGTLLDFRWFEKRSFEADLISTFEAWQSLLPELHLISLISTNLPVKLQDRTLEPAPVSQDTQALKSDKKHPAMTGKKRSIPLALHGFAHLTRTKTPFPSLRVWDPALKRNINALAVRWIPTLVFICLLGVGLLAGQGFLAHHLKKNAALYEHETEVLFKRLLPHTPAINPMAQIAQFYETLLRVNDAQNPDIHAPALQLETFSQELNNAGIALRMQNMHITPQQWVFRARIAQQADIQNVQDILLNRLHFHRTMIDDVVNEDNEAVRFTLTAIREDKP